MKLLGATVSARPWRLLSLAILAGIMLARTSVESLQADEEPTQATSTDGAELFKQHCSECHGAAGEGTEQYYARPLVGELSQEELTSFIAKSMPPDMPGTLSLADTEQVAAFVHREFYSADARRKRGRLQREPARLTARQYACLMSDLMVTFFDPPAASSQPGLEASYVAIDAKGEAKQAFSRIDPVVQFDFGTSSPAPEKIDPAEFAISWSGSLCPPATGQYEFIVRCPNSFRLYVNSKEGPPLVDGWVTSGDQSEYRGMIKLVAGRAYPFRLHFTKAGQGVQKTEALRAKIAPASVSLSWIPPGRAEETIPARYLAPIVTRETFVVQTPFPPDDRSTGFERGTSVSPEWDQATTQAAIECVEYILPRLGDLSGVVVPDAEHAATLREFCARFAERAFRCPLTPELRTLYVDRPFDSAPDPATAIERSVLMVLKSPRFLYADLPGVRAEAYATASRLSLTLWDSLPDNALLAAAASGQLTTRDQIAAHARRMAADPRATAKLREFFLQWLKADRLQELRKDTELYPQFDEKVAADLRTSFELSVENALAGEQIDFRSLLLSHHLHLNKRLAALYGVEVQSESQFEKVELPESERAGLLTHPYLMAVLADSKTSSPIRRGVFIARSLLGRVLRPPPDAVSPLAPSLHPDLTTRERAALQTSPESCQTCHALINPLGFPLETLDALGRVRSTDNGRDVDAGGHYLSRAGLDISFRGPREMATYLADSDEVHTAFVEKLFYYSAKYPVGVLGPEALPMLKQKFAEHGFDIRNLFAEVAAMASMPQAIDAPPAEPSQEN